MVQDTSYIFKEKINYGFFVQIQSFDHENVSTVFYLPIWTRFHQQDFSFIRKKKLFLIFFLEYYFRFKSLKNNEEEDHS